jgi:beta-lactam-binding protein with PASTA domain
MSLQEADSFLRTRDLRLYVADSSFSGEYGPSAVLLQNPKAGSKVKRNRVIYLTVNAKKAPLVKIPNIIDSSIKNAEQQLASFGLRMGEVRYAPHLQSGRVLAIWIDSTRISAAQVLAGYQLPKNSTISLEVGDGIGNAYIKLPSLVGMPVDEAEVYLLGIGLHVKALHYQPQSPKPIGQVVQQQPAAGVQLRRNQGVDLWVSGGAN